MVMVTDMVTDMDMVMEKEVDMVTEEIVLYIEKKVKIAEMVVDRFRRKVRTDYV